MPRRRIQTARILSELGFPTPEAAQREMALLAAASQLAQYRDECGRFERKYGMSFERFARRLERQRARESFAAEDDLMAWRFAHDAVAFWEPRVEDLQRAS